MSEKDTEIEDLPPADLETDLVDLDMDHDLGDTDLPDLEASDELLDPFVGDSLEEDPLNGSSDEHTLDDLPGGDEALSHDELSGALDDVDPAHLEDGSFDDDLGGAGDSLAGEDDQLVGDDDMPAVMAEEVTAEEVAEDEDDLEPITLSEEELDNILGTGDDVLTDLGDDEEPADMDPVGEEEILPIAGEAAADDDFAADLEAGPSLDDQLDDQLLDDVSSGEILTPVDEPGDAQIDMGDDLGDEPVIMDDLPDEISDDMSAPALDDMQDDSAASGDAGDEEEPVALSEAELDNILGDVDMDEAVEGVGEDAVADDLSGDIAGDLSDGDMLDDLPGDDLGPAPEAPAPAAGDDDDEDITLSDDELSNVLLDTDDAGLEPGVDAPAALDDDLALEAEAPPSILDGDEDDDEPVTLSMEELGNIVSDVDTEEAEDAVGIAPVGDDMLGADDSLVGADDQLVGADDQLVGADDADIGLDDQLVGSDDQLLDAGDDLIGGQDDQLVGDTDMDLGAPPELDDIGGDDLAGGLEEAAPPSILDDDEDEGPVALSEDELSNILEDVDEEQAEDIAAPVAEAIDEKNIIVLDEYEELGDAQTEADLEEPAVEETPEEAPALEPAAAVDRTELVSEAAAAGNVDTGEVKKMISYLDGLFDQLPEDTIREFSKSEYFGLYKKIMGDLGLLK